MLRGDAATAVVGRRHEKDRHPGVPGGRQVGYDPWRDKSFSLKLGGSAKYAGGLRSDKWEIPAIDAGIGGCSLGQCVFVDN